MIRRYAAELIGTFGIVFAPVAVSATGAMTGGQSGLIGAALVSGLAVLAMIYALGPISAAHFNPAVTLGFAAAKRFPWKYVAPYWAAQFAGAALAGLLAMAMFGPGHGIHIPEDPSLIGRNLATEVSITFLLMLVIIAVATDKRVSSTVPAIAIGFTVVVGVMIGGPVTGGSMNPARSLGPALFGGAPALSCCWLYLVGPPIGAVLAAVVFEAIRMDRSSAVGAPNELLEALTSVADGSK